MADETTNGAAKPARRRTAAKATAKRAVSTVTSNLPAASTRNIAIGAAAAAVAVGAGVAATVGRDRIVKASGTLIDGVKKRVASARSGSKTNGAATPAA